MSMIDRPALVGQESTDLFNGSVADEGPESVPAVLSQEAQEKAREALALYAKGKPEEEVAEALGYAPRYVRTVLAGELYVTVHVAAQIARVVGTDIHEFLRESGSDEGGMP